MRQIDLVSRLRAAFLLEVMPLRPGLDDLLLLTGAFLVGLGLWHVNPWLVAVELGVLLFLAGIVVRR